MYRLLRAFFTGFLVLLIVGILALTSLLFGLIVMYLAGSSIGVGVLTVIGVSVTALLIGMYLETHD